jgi:para-aminobenzoate synthetase component 1
MRPLIQETATSHTPESLVDQLRGEPGVILLRSALFDSPQARHSLVVARPFLTFRSAGSVCELRASERSHPQFGNPWHILDGLMARYEVIDEMDLPFPLGGCFGFWGYDLKNFVEPKLTRRAVNDLELPDCQVGFYGSLVVFDHRVDKAWIVSTGLGVDGARDERQARQQLDFWRQKLRSPSAKNVFHPRADRSSKPGREITQAQPRVPSARSNFSQTDFIERVECAKRYIRAGDIYQVNLSQRLTVPCAISGWQLYQRLAAVSPAPFAAYLDCGEFQLASSSPELFLRLSGRHILTRPIKGTRPRSSDPTRDAQLTYELQTSPKEMAELVMITDLLRNDLGKVCEFGSVQVPELVRLERYAQVQHLASTIEGRLRPNTTHFGALAACFPGGSITGAPKFRAMDIIEELEPLARGPYTGCIGYLGFNRESQLSIAIRTAIRKGATAFFHAGAGIVADSDPEFEYHETLAKAHGFLTAMECSSTPLSGSARPPASTVSRLFRPNWKSGAAS